MPGRYADFGVIDDSFGIFSVSGGVLSGLAETYEINFTASLAGAGDFSVSLRFGPQGRNFDSNISIDAGVEAEIAGIGISLGNVHFSENSISITLGAEEFSYSRDTLDTQFVSDIEEFIGTEEAAEAAALAAEILGAGMDVFNSFGKLFIVNSKVLPPRPTFTAKFEDAIETPDQIISDVDLPTYSDLVEGFPTVTSIEIYGENFVALTYDEDLPYERVEVYYRGDDWSVVPEGLADDVTQEEWIAEVSVDSFAARILSSSDVFFTLSSFGFVDPDGEQASDGLVYRLDTEGGVQDAFNNSTVFGGGGTDEIVSGTDTADTINSSYVDFDGDIITDNGQLIEAGDGRDRIYDGAGDDTVYGGNGRDLFFAGDGADEYHGGADRDEVYYSTSTEGLTIDMENAANSTGIAAGDTYHDVEYVHGSNFDDVIVSNADRVFGRAGDDIIQDADGIQRMFGGGGSDTFVFIDNDGDRDRISDFNLGEDMIDLSLWGVTSLNDAGLLIEERTDGQGNLQGDLVITFNGNNNYIRIDGLDTSDISALDSSHFIFV